MKIMIKTLPPFKDMHPSRKLWIRMFAAIILLGMIAFIIFYNLPSQKLKREAASIIKKLDSINATVELISSMDLEKYNLEKNMWNKLENFIYKENQVAIYDPTVLEKFINENLNIKDVIKANQKTLAEMEFLKNQIRECRKLMEKINLADRESLSEKYKELFSETNHVLNYLTYFCINYIQAIEFNQEPLKNLMDFIMSENQEAISQHTERYFKHSSIFKDLYFNNFKKAKAIHREMLTKTKKWEKIIPDEKDEENLIKELSQQKLKPLYRVEADLNGNGAKDLAIMLKSDESKYFLKIYNWKDKKFNLIYAQDLGIIESYEPPSGQAPPSMYKPGIHLKYSSLIPEIIIIYREYSPTWNSFKFNGTDFEEIH